MLWFLMGAAYAGSVYVNGVNVDGLRNQTFENVSVTIDARGDVQITAPGYRIEVEKPSSTATVTSASGSTVATTTTTTYTVPATASVTTSTAPAKPPVMTASGVQAGRWWMVTEDNASHGHTIEVYVNGNLVQTVHSGDAQMIVDLGAYLRPGANTVHVQSSSVSASGGSIYVYVGGGNNDSGTVMLDHPDIQYGLGAQRQGPYSRDYTLNVP